MAWADQTDALVAQCVRTFGRTVRYRRGDHDPFDLTAIFGHPNQEDAAVYGQGVTLDVRIADFIGTAADPGPQKGDTVLVGGLVYTIYLVQVGAEGTGKLFMALTVGGPGGGVNGFGS